jgi:HK97 gp10 family phage protein
MQVSFKVEGLKEVLAAFDELAGEIGDKKARSKILVPAVREAMKPVLTTAKSTAPVDTGALSRTLIVEARRPTRKDKRSKYIHETDTVIAAVTTKAFPKKLKNQFFAENESLYRSDKKEYRAKFKEFAYSIDFPYDARAIAQEFGSAHNAAHPFLRPAMESQAPQTAKRLGEIIGRRLLQYKAKQK